MPVSIRNRDNMEMPVANSLGFAFLNRNARACDAPERLLDGIHRETEAIKRCRLGLYFLGGLNTFRNVPGLIPWFLCQPRCRATVVLSNIGRLFSRISLPRNAGKVVCGDAVLQSVRGVPPIRPLTRASLIAMTYAGRTEIHLNCDPHHFDSQTQEEFLSAYIATLERLVRA